MQSNDISKRLIELLEEKQYHLLHQEMANMHEADIADFIEELSSEQAAITFRLLPKSLAAAVFSYLEIPVKERLLAAFTDREVTELVEKMFVDDAVDMIEELPANAVTRVLELTTPETREVLNRLLKYPEDSAGSLMTVEFTKLSRTMTVLEAINSIRRFGKDRETIYTCYVTSVDRILEGVISVRQLMLAQDDELVVDLMETEVISVNTSTDREEVVQVFRDYDFIALPVVDNENRLVGIVTIDDVLDVADEEATEDFQKMAAIQPSEKPYLQTSVWEHFKSRFVWMMALMLSGMLNGSILGRYENAFLAMPLLVTFIPMLTDTGGNAGSQSSTLVIRGMAISEINYKDFWKVVWTELRVSFAIGFGLSAINFIRVYLQYGNNVLVALVVSLSLLFIVILSKLCGSVLPIAAKALRVDPAVMAAPLISTIVDALGLILYFNIASRLLGL